MQVAEQVADKKTKPKKNLKWNIKHRYLYIMDWQTPKPNLI